MHLQLFAQQQTSAYIYHCCTKLTQQAIICPFLMHKGFYSPLPLDMDTICLSSDSRTAWLGLGCDRSKLWPPEWKSWVCGSHFGEHTALPRLVLEQICFHCWYIDSSCFLTGHEDSWQNIDIWRAGHKNGPGRFVQRPVLHCLDPQLCALLEASALHVDTGRISSCQPLPLCTDDTSHTLPWYPW